ncbi:hypothetical protein MM239_09885 [Belliella sp. DSM 111904]|uniref:RES domain-containing protein n=1 Tax=Belliella filtrata TaxID=2923435 RepID=A0ABS9V0E2_9BACT|nr:hypothetical protein [Belliella filtrata]MCH7409704.1 hypothetical protein [Belliella filtrata]
MYISLADLKIDWESTPPSQFSQDIGDEFLNKYTDLVLAVPSSAIVNQENNFTINPLQPKMIQVKIESIDPIRFEPLILNL